MDQSLADAPGGEYLSKGSSHSSVQNLSNFLRLYRRFIYLRKGVIDFILAL
jgi:hypothetical protein